MPSRAPNGTPFRRVPSHAPTGIPRRHPTSYSASIQKRRSHQALIITSVKDALKASLQSPTLFKSAVDYPSNPSSSASSSFPIVWDSGASVCVTPSRNDFVTYDSTTLFSEVFVSKCKVKYGSEKMLIKLRKKFDHQEWSTLFGGGANKKSTNNNDNDDVGGEEEEENEEEVQNRNAIQTIGELSTEDESTPQTSSTTIPNRPYASNTDWNEVERTITQQEENESIPPGESGFNKFMQDIYKNADEDTKRAMIKSYQTSGGTHLSCNWNEVAKTDYEKVRTAPKGQEWKNWEGEKLPMKDD